MPLEERKTLGMGPLRMHVKYVLRSGNVAKEYPLSTIVDASSERAKTTEVMKFNDIGAIVQNDLTAYGLAKIITDMKPIEREIFHHLIIPDLERIGARSRTVRKQLVTMLQILMQEGMTRITTHETELNCNPPFRLGVIMCTTPADLRSHRIFRRISFLRRLIPFSYDFSKKHKADILKYVELSEHLEKEHFEIGERFKTDVILPQKFKAKLNMYAKMLVCKIEDFAVKDADSKLIGVSAKEQFMCYLKAIALDHKRKIVTGEDFEEFERMYRYFNFDMNELEFEED